MITSRFINTPAILEIYELFQWSRYGQMVAIRVRIEFHRNTLNIKNEKREVTHGRNERGRANRSDAFPAVCARCSRAWRKDEGGVEPRTSFLGGTRFDPSARHTYIRNLISCILEAALPVHDRFRLADANCRGTSPTPPPPCSRFPSIKTTRPLTSFFN